MTTLTIELPPDLYERLRKEAQQAGRPVEALSRSGWCGASHPQRRLASASGRVKIELVW